MSLNFSFGSFAAGRSGAAPLASGKFRVALLGDFSARANRGQLETGAALAARKSIKVDCDNLEKVFQRLAAPLRLQLGSGVAELTIRSLEDFHPEQLFESLEIFSELAGLRQRLKTTSTFAKAAAEVQAWSGTAEAADPLADARGATVPIHDSLDDFAQLIGRPTVEQQSETPIEDLLRQVVAPYIVPAKDPRQDALVASVDEALSATMRLILHHPDFQALESLWRSADLLVRRVETGPGLEIVLFDLTAEEMASDLGGAQALEESALYKLLVEQPASDAQQGPFSVIAGHYTFARTRPHAALLGRLARVAAEASAAVAVAIDSKVLAENPQELAPEVVDAWKNLGALPEAAYLALLAPRFLLRQPYGKRSDPVDCFAFEEITPKTGLTGFLWGNPVALAGLLLAEAWSAEGKKMSLGSHQSVGDLPFFYYTDKDGDQVALPCTEVLMTTREATLLSSQGFIPLVSLKGSPEVRLGSFNSFAGSALAGPWAPLNIARATGGAVSPAVSGSVPAAAVVAAAPEPAAPVEAPAAAPAAPEEPEAADSTGDSELDALLADLAPAPDPTGEAAAPPPEPQPGDLDPELEDLLKGL